MRFKTVKDIAIFLRDEMDKYAGKEFPESFISLFKELCDDPVYRTKIFDGIHFSAGFTAVLGKKRCRRLAELRQSL